jgi:hypothetical protein
MSKKRPRRRDIASNHVQETRLLIHRCPLPSSDSQSLVRAYLGHPELGNEERLPPDCPGPIRSRRLNDSFLQIARGLRQGECGDRVMKATLIVIESDSDHARQKRWWAGCWDLVGALTEFEWWRKPD